MDSLVIYIPLGLAIIGGIIWLVRLEGRVNVATNEVNDVSTDYYAHKDNRDIHPKMSDVDRRLGEFHEDISELKKDVKEGLAEINRRLDVVLQKQ